MKNQFSASEPLLGYLYQIQCALLHIITIKNDDAKLLIELIDDYTIETEPGETEPGLIIVQTKHHNNSRAHLTNTSTDLWKTLRVWSTLIKNGEINLENCIFRLITSASATADSIPFLLKASTKNERDITNIQKLILETISSSNNNSNFPAHEAFLSLKDEQQKTLIKNIVVLDESIGILDIEQEILRQLFYSAYPNQTEALYQRLLGWFYNQVILQLLKKAPAITGRDVRMIISNFSESMKLDNLPADYLNSFEDDQNVIGKYSNYIFIKQLEIININNKLINIAISDYYRAYSQKSKWLKEGFIIYQDEIDYDKRLVDDWKRKFAKLANYVGNTNIAKKKGKEFYEQHYVDSAPNINFKNRFNEGYMITGCCHILSNEKKIGWHPDFEVMV